MVATLSLAVGIIAFIRHFEVKSMNKKKFNLGLFLLAMVVFIISYAL